MAKHKKTMPPAFMRKGGKSNEPKGKPPMTEMPKRMHGKRGS